MGNGAIGGPINACRGVVAAQPRLLPGRCHRGRALHGADDGAKAPGRGGDLLLVDAWSCFY